MVTARNTTKPNAQVDEKGLGFYAFSADYGPKWSCDGTLPKDMTIELTRLMILVSADMVPVNELREFVDAFLDALQNNGKAAK